MKMIVLKLMLALLFVPLITGSALAPQPEELVGPLVCFSDRPASHVELEKLFSSQNYNWSTLDDGIPSIFLEALPTDLNHISQVKKKKIVFFLSLLPVVLRANEEIRGQKNFLNKLFNQFDQGDALSDNERNRLLAIAREYKISGNPFEEPQARKELLKRVDTLPTSLVLAQAATESAYGTSRFARLGNNLFGEWTFNPGSGMVPNDRPEGEIYELRCFSSIYESISSYMKNLNTHPAYKSLRNIRAQLRSEGKSVRGVDLAEGLILYSQRGEEYVSQIQTVIRNNRLNRLASVIFRQDSSSEDDERIVTAGLLSSVDPSSRFLLLQKNP